MLSSTSQPEEVETTIHPSLFISALKQLFDRGPQERRQQLLTFEARKTHLGHRTCQILQGQRIKAREKNKNRNKNWRQGKKRVGTQKVRELEDHSGDVSDKQRQKQVQSTETLENTTLFIYPSKQTSCWHKPKIAVRKVSFTLRSLHFSFINVHVCYPSTPTFSSKSLICLLWISVLSSRSRILCKHRKKMEKSVFFFSRTKRPNEPPDAFCRDHLVSLVQQFHPLLEDLAVVLATLPQHLPPQLLHRRPQLILLQLIQRFAVFYHLKEGFFL